MLTATEVGHMVPLPSLSSPVSTGVPVCYERLIAVLRSELSFLSDFSSPDATFLVVVQGTLC